jgi:hypothetical protein
MDSGIQKIAGYFGNNRIGVEIDIKRERYVGFVFIRNGWDDAVALSMADVPDVPL